MKKKKINELKKQVKIVRNLVKKKRKNSHVFYETLLKRLQTILEVIEANKVSELEKNVNLNGALRAYFDTSLVNSYDEPLVIELDKLESMLK